MLIVYTMEFYFDISLRCLSFKIYIYNIQFFHRVYLTGSTRSMREVRIVIVLETESQRARKLAQSHSKVEPVFEPKSWDLNSKYCLE